MAKSKNRKKQEATKVDKFLMGVLVLLILISIVLLFVRLIGGKTISSSDERVKELHDYFSTESLNNCEGLLNYTEDKIEFADISNETRLCLAYQKSDIKDYEELTYNPDKKKTICTTDDKMVFRVNEESKKCEVKKIKQNIIDDTYKKIFGKEIEKNDKFQADNLNICYLKDGYYYCGLSETFTYTLGSEALIYRVVNKAVEKSSEIIIYDYFAKIMDNQCFKAYTTTTVNQKCTDNYDKDKELDFDFLKNYGSQYKHVYKKASDGTYYWVSSELIK